MRKQAIVLSLVSCAALLCSCGEDKKISVAGESIIAEPSQNADSGTSIKHEYIEKFGETLAAFHGLDFEDTLIAKNNEGKEITVSIDVTTSVASKQADTVYHYDKLVCDENIREQLVHTFLGEGDIYCGDFGCHPKTEIQKQINEYARDIKLKTDELNNLDDDNKWMKESLEYEISYLQSINDSYEKQLEAAPEDWEPVESYEHNSYWVYGPDGNDKISIDFGSYDAEAEPLDDHPIVSIIQYPYAGANSRIKPEDALKIISDLFNRFGVLPVSSDDKDIRIEQLETSFGGNSKVYYTLVTARPNIPGFSDEDFLYLCTFFDDKVTISLHSPIKEVSEVKNNPLLSFEEVKSVVKNDIPEAIASYYRGSKSTYFYVSSLVLDLTNDPASNSIVPTWRVYTNEGGPVKYDAEILRINAIDGSQIEITNEVPYSPL